MSNREELQKSVKLALDYVERLEQLNKLRSLKAPVKIIMYSEESVAKAQVAVDADPYAIEFVPQAYIYTTMMEARNRFITDNTELGVLNKIIEDLHIEQNMKAEDCPNIFGNFETIAEIEDQLIGILKNGDPCLIVDALAEILIAVKVDLLYTDIPPRPSIFRYKEISVDPKKLN